MTKALTVGDVYQLVTTDAKVINQNASKQQVVKVLLSGSSTTRYVYVVDDLGKLQGIITVHDIINCMSVKIGYTPRNLSIRSAYKLFSLSPFGATTDLMRAPVHVTKATDLETALKKMADNKLSELPVIDEDGTVIGELNAFELLKFI